MARRKIGKEDTFEYFYFTVDDSVQGVAVWDQPPSLEISPGHYDAHDGIRVVDKLRNKTHRKFNRVELHLLVSPIPTSGAGAWIPHRSPTYYGHNSWSPRLRANGP